MRALASALLLTLLAAAGNTAVSEEPEPFVPIFEVPVRCDTRTACFIQNYIDAQPGRGARDLTCGPLTYDGHDGLDIRIPPGPKAMETGVPVIAAAAGIVRAVRDGMPDISISKIGAHVVAGREAGNAVVITHGVHGETQYSHLRLGSIVVRPGDVVETGALLGMVGLSGNSEFPHVHFSVRRDGITLDPFTGLPPANGCGVPGKSLWSAAAQRALPYRPGGLLSAGFTTAVLDLETALSGSANSTALSTTEPALVFWAASWGLREGDKETIRVLRPDGTVMIENGTSVPGNKAQWLRYAGRKLREAAWPAGRYRGEYRVVRQVDGKDVVIVETAQEIEVR
ncbi:MAG: M23 family metallopeptidase [Alphaproteobacteria bacterium]